MNNFFRASIADGAYTITVNKELALLFDAE